MEKINQAVEHCFLQAEQYFQRRFERPMVSLKLTGQSAGMAHINKNKLRFNQAMYRLQPEVFVAQTVPHEVAHLVAYKIFGHKIKPHGAEWQWVMRSVFEQEPKRTHQFQLAEKAQRKVRKYHYQCACSGDKQQHFLSAQRHGLITNKCYRYHCKLCKSALIFTGNYSFA